MKGERERQRHTEKEGERERESARKAACFNSDMEGKERERKGFKQGYKLSHRGRKVWKQRILVRNTGQVLIHWGFIFVLFLSTLFSDSGKILACINAITNTFVW